MTSRSCLLLPLFGVALLLGTGCGHAATAHPAADASSHRAAPVAAAPAYHGAGVAVSGDIVKTCNIVVDNVDKAPKFDFDEASLTPQDRQVLDQVATCITTGPLKSKSLKLVGRADPRGEIEYNFVLGMHRAASVEDYLSQDGASKSKLLETSRGKLDATGTDEAGWALDRRVDIEL